MNDGLKQRLIGAIVLLCLALILWPLIFSDPAPELDRTSQIPPTPAFEKFAVAEPKRVDKVPAIVSPKHEDVTIAQDDARKAVEGISRADSRPILDDKSSLPEAWVLQVASFSKAENAQQLERALKAKGQKAFTRTYQSNGSQSTRVYIGPRFRKTAFTKDKADIDKEFSVNSLVVRFQQ